MSDVNIKDKQKEAFYNLMNQVIPEIIASKSFDEDDFSCQFKVFPSDLHNPIEEDGTVYTIVKAECTVKNKNTLEEQVVYFDLLKVPVYQTLGFKVKGNYTQVLDVYGKTSGWSFQQKPNKNEIRGKLSSIVTSAGSRNISFVFNEKGVFFTTNRKTTDDDKVVKVSVATLFKALTGYSNDEMLNIFGYDNPYNLLVFSEDLGSRHVCIEKAANAILPESLKRSSNTTQKQRDLEKYLFNKNYFNLGSNNKERLEYVQSFRNRAVNKTLAKTITLADEVVEEGTILTEAILERIDNSPIDTIFVNHNGKKFRLLKFSHFTFRALGYLLANDTVVGDTVVKKNTKLDLDTLQLLNKTDLTDLTVINPNNQESLVISRRLTAESLEVNDLFTAYNIFINNVNGFDAYDNEYELTDRIVIPFDKKAAQFVDEHLDKIQKILKKNLAFIKTGSEFDATYKSLDKAVNKKEITEEEAELYSQDTEKAVKKYNELKTNLADSSLINIFNDSLNNAFSTDALLVSLRGSTNPECAISNITNIMSYQSLNYKITIGKGADKIKSDDLIKVQDTQAGRLDPFDQPESSKIGKVHHKTVLSQVNENGEITAPYFRVKNGKVISDEPVYITAKEETGKYIAEWNETFLDENGEMKKRIYARHDGSVVTIDTNLVTLKEFSPIQTMSPARLNIPFQNHSAGKRLQMGCNHEKQATMLPKSERALVGTGGESILDFGIYRASDVLAEYYNSLSLNNPELAQYKDLIMGDTLKLVSISSHNSLREYTFELLGFKKLCAEKGYNAITTTTLTVPYLQHTPEKSVFTYHLNAKLGEFKGDDIVAYNSGCDIREYAQSRKLDFGGLAINEKDLDKGIALGVNLPIVFKTFGSSTIDDALTISSELVYDSTLTSIALISKKEELIKNNEFVEEFKQGGEAVDYFDTNGLPKVGTILKPNDPYICKTRKRLDTGIQSIEYSYLNEYMEGQVVSASISQKNGKEVAEVTIATLSNIEPADKLSGQHGNKGVVAKIVPMQEMPYDPITGERAAVCVNPLGVPSRMNISQLLVVTLGLAMKRRGEIALISPFHAEGADFVREMAEKENVHPRKMIDGRTGLYFERPINFGYLYMMKLVHLVRKKINSIGLNHPIDKVTLQPKKGAAMQGGQAFGEMESWVLQCAGADKLLNEIQTTASNDRLNRNNLIKAINENPYEIYNSTSFAPADAITIEQNNINDSSMLTLMRSCGINLTTESSDGEQCYKFDILKDEEIRSLSVIPTNSVAALHSPDIFGDSKQSRRTTNRYRWSWIDLECKMILPPFFSKGNILKFIIIDEGASKKNLSINIVKDIMKQVKYIDADTLDGIVSIVSEKFVKAYPDSGNYITGMPALIQLFECYDMSVTLDYYKTKLDKIEVKKEKALQQQKDVVTFEQVLNDYGFNFEELNGTEVSLVEEDDNYIKNLKCYNFVQDFISSGKMLSDYIVTAFPVMPQVFRPEIKMEGQESISDFDWHYSQILNAVNAYRNMPTSENHYNIFLTISNFIGIDFDKSRKPNKKKKTILSYFFGDNSSSKKDHGKLRDTMQKKRICRSGRSTIIPSPDPEMTPLEIGIPISMIINILDYQLHAHLSNYFVINSKGESPYSVSRSDWEKLLEALSIQNRKKFMKIYNQKFKDCFALEPSEDPYNFVFNCIKDFVEGTNGEPTGPGGRVIKPQVCIAGRQPSLHVFAIRGYYPKVVFSKAIYIHHLVCKGYNADFDGDQMWVYFPIFEDTKEEAINLLSAQNSIINPKDNSIILEHSQDIALGVYCATMLQDNAEELSDDAKRSIRFYSSLSSIERDIDVNSLRLYDVVCYRHFNQRKYLSTAGRILFNAMFPDGFTDKVFTNSLAIPFVNNESYCDLKYDSLITTGKSNSKILDSSRLQDICKSYYRDQMANAPWMSGITCIDIFQRILEFGFKYADKYSVSISLDDLDEISKGLDKNEIISKADIIKTKIENDYQDGLISEEDKKNAITSLYEGANTAIGNKLLKIMNRNNNIFIMFDSGARGSKNQIVQTCGAVGILQKTKTENLETSVTSNYYEGLSSFDLQQTSYSTRISVASTQNESQIAGYATRQTVYMENGLTIVEFDCGKKDWWFDVLWGEPIDSYCKFIPSMKYFGENLLGRKVFDKQSKILLGDTLDAEGRITLESYKIFSNGFKRIQLMDETEEIKLPNSLTRDYFNRFLVNNRLTGAPFSLDEACLSSGFITDNSFEVLKNYGGATVTIQKVSTIEMNDLLTCSEVVDEKTLQLMKNFLKDGKIPKVCLPMITKNHLMQIETDNGTFEYRYRMTTACRSLLNGRLGRNLPYLEEYSDAETTSNNHYIHVITEKTLDEIERLGLTRIEARILLDCETGREDSKHGKSHHGICACCYGLKYTNRLLPKVGDIVGIEAAQAVGEPAAQLTMNLVHSGGAAGSSVANGIALFTGYLGGGEINKGENDAAIAPLSGYVSVTRQDTNSLISIQPENVDNQVCKSCRHFAECARFRKCHDDGKCTISKKYVPKMILCKDGEYVQAGEPLTYGFVMPNNINYVGEPYSFEELLRKKQMTSLLNYFNNFKNNNINVEARHFEILARSQNFLVTVMQSDSPDFVPGKSYYYSEIKNSSANVKFFAKTTKQEDVILRGGGALSRLSFGNFLDAATVLAEEGHKSYYNSCIGQITAGEDLILNEKKSYKAIPVFTREKQESVKQFEFFVNEEEQKEFDSFNFSDNIFDDLLGLDVFEDTGCSIDATFIVEDSLEPLSNAVIEVKDTTGSVVQNVTTTGEGFFEVSGLSEGQYSLRLVSDELQIESDTITLTKGNSLASLGIINVKSLTNNESMENFFIEDDFIENEDTQEPTENNVVTYKEVVNDDNQRSINVDSLSAF